MGILAVSIADWSAPDIEITPEMVVAGASVLWELEGEVSKEALARAVYEAMAKAGVRRASPQREMNR